MVRGSAGKPSPGFHESLLCSPTKSCRESCHPTHFTEGKAEVQHMLPAITQLGNWDVKSETRAQPGPACLAPPWASPTLQECEAGIPSLAWAAPDKLEGRGRGHCAGTSPRQIGTGVGVPAQLTQLLPSPAPQARALSPP